MDNVPGEAIKNFALIILALLGGAYYIKEIFFSGGKKQVSVQQPVSVTITEELHKVFASKEAFEDHVAENRGDHDKIFSKIGGVERGAAARLEEKLSQMQTEGRHDRSELHNKVNDARESIAGLEKETEIQNQTLSAVQSDIKRILERLPRH